MCDPISAIGAVLSVGSGLAEMAQQQQEADNQNALYAANRQNALMAFQNKQVQLNDRISQEKEAAAQQNFDTSLAAQKALATNQVAAGESGAVGNSTDALMNDIQSTSQRQQDRVNINTDWTVQQLAAQKVGTSYEAVDRINSVRQATQPNFMGSMLKIAGGAFKAATPDSGIRSIKASD